MNGIEEDLTPTITTETEHVGETLAVPLPPLEPQETELQEDLMGTDSSRLRNPITLDEDAINRSLQPSDEDAINRSDEDAINRSLQTFDEEPLNELEWLDVISAEQDMPEVQYVPDVANAPPLLEEAWSAEEPIPYDEDPQERDLAQEVDDTEESRVDEEETATNTSIETLLSTKTTKAINPPGRHRSKNKHKGKNTTGSFRS